MLKTMPALVKAEAAPGLVLREVEVPSCGPNEVLIRVKKTGICGTDIHINDWDEWSQRRLHPPVTIGHEFVGEIVQVGAAVSAFRVGEIVSGEGHIGCGVCYFCRTGQGHICRSVQILGVDRNGCFAEFVSLPQNNVWRVKPGIDLNVASIFDPFGNAMHTVMAQPVAGRTVAIVGAGPIGLMAVLIARAAGALTLSVVEPIARKRELAKACGAEFTHDPSNNGWRERFLAETPEAVGVDVALEMSGSPDGIHSAFDIVRPGGDVALLGIPPADVTLNLSDSIIFKAAHVRGINGRLIFETWYQCERFLLDHKLDLTPLITHRFHYTQFEEAFRVLNRGEAVKVVLDWE